MYIRTLLHVRFKACARVRGPDLISRGQNQGELGKCMLLTLIHVHVDLVLNCDRLLVHGIPTLRV